MYGKGTQLYIYMYPFSPYIYFKNFFIDFWLHWVFIAAPELSRVVAHRLSHTLAWGIFPDQGLNLRSLYWQVDSQPLDHQGSPKVYYYYFFLIQRPLFIVWSLSHDTTLCDPMDCSPPGSSIHRISQARILERIAISFSRGPSWPRDQTHVSCTGRRILYHWATREAQTLE